MIRKIFYRVFAITSSLLMFASVSGLALPFQNGSAIKKNAEPSDHTAQRHAVSIRAVAPVFEAPTTTHQLQTIADVVECFEQETEDDDEASAHTATATILQSLRLAASYFANAPPSCASSHSVPLYILHHCWRHFPSRVF